MEIDCTDCENKISTKTANGGESLLYQIWKYVVERNCYVMGLLLLCDKKIGCNTTSCIIITLKDSCTL